MAETRSCAVEGYASVLDSRFRKAAALAVRSWKDREDFCQEMHMAYLEYRRKLSDPDIPLNRIVWFCARRAYDRMYRKGKSVDSYPRKDVSVESFWVNSDSPDGTYQREVPDTTDVAEEVIDRLSTEGFVKTLTPIQQKTVLLLMDGYSMADVARTRNVDESTVRECVRAVRRKSKCLLSV